MYATVADLRDEGVSEARASDARLGVLLDEASRGIDRVTGWFFEPRAMTLALSGRGTAGLEPPVPPIRLERMRVLGAEVPVSPSHLRVVGAPVMPGFDAPRLVRTRGVFPRGWDNVEVEGLWGYTEPDGSATGRTPLEVRRACMLLVLRWLAPIGDESVGPEARDPWRVLEERTRDQAVKFDRARPGHLTGDPEVDRILARYRRPMGLGAA